MIVQKIFETVKKVQVYTAWSPEGTIKVGSTDSWEGVNFIKYAKK